MKPHHLLYAGLALCLAQCVPVYSDMTATDDADHKGTPEYERQLPQYYRTETECNESDEFKEWPWNKERPYCYNRGWQDWGEWQVLLPFADDMHDSPDEGEDDQDFEDREHSVVPGYSEAIPDDNYSLRLNPSDTSPVAFAQGVTPVTPELSFFVVTEVCSPLATSAPSLAGMPRLFILEDV